MMIAGRRKTEVLNDSNNRLTGEVAAKQREIGLKTASVRRRRCTTGTWRN